MRTIDSRLASARRQLAALDAKIASGRGIAEHFHLGRVGFERRGLRRRRARQLDATIDAAVRANELRREVRHLEQQREAAAKGPWWERDPAGSLATIERMIAAESTTGGRALTGEELSTLREMRREVRRAIRRWRADEILGDGR